MIRLSICQVNSFGFGGSNAVVIVDDSRSVLAAAHTRETRLRGNGHYEGQTVSRTSSCVDHTIMMENEIPQRHHLTPKLVAWSAAGEHSARALSKQYDELLNNGEMLRDAEKLQDLIYTLIIKRTIFLGVPLLYCIL